MRGRVRKLLSLSSLIALATATEVCIDEEPSLKDAALLQLARSDVPRRSFHGYGLSSKIWMGLDETNETTQASVPSSDEAKTVGRTDPQVRFKIMGHFNTGTHLIRELIVATFGDAVDVASPDEVGFSNCTFWKHSPLRLVPDENSAPCNRSNIIGISVVRNPFSWLESLHSNPYDLESCTQGKDWLIRNCSFPDEITEKLPQLRGVSYPSVEDIWNQWTEDYEFLRPQIFNKSLLFTYEEMVLDTSKLLDRIAKISNLTIPTNQSKVSALMAKQAVPWVSQASNSRTLAAQKIKTSEFMKSFQPAAIDVMCSRLNIRAMRRYGYTECDV